jgi:acetyltransferase
VREHAGVKAFEGVTVQPMIHQRDSYEVILGATPDPQFGPVLLFGSGGQLVEVYKDKALGLPPLNTTLARRLMERTKIFQALKGVRGRKPIDLKALDQLLVRFSQLVADHRRLKEIDINPLLVSPEGMIALDARVVLHDPKMKDAELPEQAIRPYPSHYTSKFQLKDGTRVTIRPIRHQDEPLMVKFHQSLSERSVYLRYFQALKLDQRVTHERLMRRCFIDYDREIALVAERKESKTSEREFLGVARLIKLHGTSEAEFALLVSDQAQRKGLGLELLKRLISVAHDEKIERLRADILPENEGMRRLLTHLHFTFDAAPQDSTVRASLLLEPS